MNMPPTTKLPEGWSVRFIMSEPARYAVYAPGGKRVADGFASWGDAAREVFKRASKTARS